MQPHHNSDKCNFHRLALNHTTHGSPTPLPPDTRTVPLNNLKGLGDHLLLLFGLGRLGARLDDLGCLLVLNPVDLRLSTNWTRMGARVHVGAVVSTDAGSQNRTSTRVGAVVSTGAG